MLDFLFSIISWWFSNIWYWSPLLFLIYYLTDFNYYLRVIVTVAFAKRLRSRIGFLEPSEVYGIVLPNDADFLFTHMNNARYFREYDFARLDHAARVGYFRRIQKGGGAMAAHTIRYRQPVMMFSVFKIITKAVYWDAKFIYYEQRIVSNGIVRCVGYSKVKVNFNVEEFVGKHHPTIKKPEEMPEDMKSWLKYLNESSEMMKKENLVWKNDLLNHNNNISNGHIKVK